MDDNRIIELYLARDERAIEETKAKYGRLLLSVANSILRDRLDSEECESDTYVKAWESIPPARPTYFSAYLTRITRNLAINRLRYNKRHRSPEIDLIYEEIAETLPDVSTELSEEIELRDALNDFIGGLDMRRRKMLVMRYFYMLSIKEIAFELEMNEGSVKSVLSRLRGTLREYLVERGIAI